MPKLTKRRWNTCGCRKGEAPESSCVFHGVGSYLVLLQFTRVGEERHVVTGAAHTPRMSNHYVGELYGIETLCDRKMPVIVPWGREANEGTYEEQHRALVETELLEGDGRYNQCHPPLRPSEFGTTCHQCLVTGASRAYRLSTVALQVNSPEYTPVTFEARVTQVAPPTPVDHVLNALQDAEVNFLRDRGWVLGDGPSPLWMHRDLYRGSEMGRDEAVSFQKAVERTMKVGVVDSTVPIVIPSRFDRVGDE